MLLLGIGSMRIARATASARSSTKRSIHPGSNISINLQENTPPKSFNGSKRAFQVNRVNCFQFAAIAGTVGFREVPGGVI